MLNVRTISEYDPFDNPPDDWPGRKFYVSQHAIKREQYELLRDAVASGCTETQAERILADNPELLSMLLFMFSTGHHASWLFPKKWLRPPSDGPGGIIPDYVLAGANSDGVNWYVLELKGPQHRAFKKEGRRVYLSSYANKGVGQLLNYMDTASRSQAYLRDELGLTGFREPRGVLLIGTEEETQDDDIRRFKSAWNRTNPKLLIRSYSALLREIATKVATFDRRDETV